LFCAEQMPINSNRLLKSPPPDRPCGGYSLAKMSPPSSDVIRQRITLTPLPPLHPTLQHPSPTAGVASPAITDGSGREFETTTINAISDVLLTVAVVAW
jgi:hypothetical protein